jgi:transcriptional regulator GlxA family with amidase domain
VFAGKNKVSPAPICTGSPAVGVKLHAPDRMCITSPLATLAAFAGATQRHAAAPPIAQFAAVPRPRYGSSIRGPGPHYGERLPLEDLAAIARLSVFRFATVFRQRVGESPHRYICRLRVERAQALLRDGMPAAIVATETGFYDQSHLSRHFKSACGMTPGQYLSQTRGAAGPRLVRAA